MSPPVAPGNLQPMDYHVKSKYRAAAFRASRLFPGVIGQVLSDEIMCLEEFGWAPGAMSRGRLLIADLDTIESVEYVRRSRG